ncbi:hypothetical protein [Mesorhizobium huakuii]|uniref:hypothetical protein n=1 Tax=Mesorhizobium huakuii TaxID=28104 RepID=UPI0016151358|nr:hypothetical protein [Mesorhizobium huakuii]
MLPSKRHSGADGALFALLISRTIRREQLAIFVAVERHDDDQLRFLLAGKDVIRHSVRLTGAQLQFDLVERLGQNFDRLQIDGEVEVTFCRLEYQNSHLGLVVNQHAHPNAGRHVRWSIWHGLPPSKAPIAMLAVFEAIPMRWLSRPGKTKRCALGASRNSQT